MSLNVLRDLAVCKTKKFTMAFFPYQFMNLIFKKSRGGYRRGALVRSNMVNECKLYI